MKGFNKDTRYMRFLQYNILPMKPLVFRLKEAVSDSRCIGGGTWSSTCSQEQLLEGLAVTGNGAHMGDLEVTQLE